MGVFGEYYVKTAGRRLLFIVLLALLTFALGFAVLGGRVVPADGMTIEKWLQRFYLCGGICHYRKCQLHGGTWKGTYLHANEHRIVP